MNDNQLDQLLQQYADKNEANNKAIEQATQHIMTTVRHEVRKAKIKKLATFYSRTGESCTTLDDGALNFCVRNGNRCDNSSMVTSKKLISWELKRITTFEMRE